MIRKPSQARRKQHFAVNRQDIVRIVDGSDNKNNELTSFKKTFIFLLYYSFHLHFIKYMFQYFKTFISYFIFNISVRFYFNKQRL